MKNYQYEKVHYYVINVKKTHSAFYVVIYGQIYHLKAVSNIYLLRFISDSLYIFLYIFLSLFTGQTSTLIFSIIIVFLLIIG